MLDPDNNTTTTAIRSVTSDARVFADSDVVVTVTLVGEPRLGAGKNYRRNRSARCSNVVDFGSSGAAIGQQKFKVVVVDNCCGNVTFVGFLEKADCRG